jgi:hypothetical protein
MFVFDLFNNKSTQDAVKATPKIVAPVVNESLTGLGNRRDRFKSLRKRGLDEVDPHRFDSDEDFYNAVRAPAPRRPVNDYPYTQQQDDDYFREIFRKKRLAAQKAEREADHDRLATGLNETELSIGDDVIISGKNNQFEGSTGIIDSFGSDHRFIVVNLYNHGKHSFHASDVSINEYADSDEEENDWQERSFNESALRESGYDFK